MEIVLQLPAAFAFRVGPDVLIYLRLKIRAPGLCAGGLMKNPTAPSQISGFRG